MSRNAFADLEREHNRRAEHVEMSAEESRRSSTRGRKGYCAWCKHNHGDLPEAAAVIGNKCHQCWFTDEKPNWEAEEE